MINCHISNEIAIHADQPDSVPVSETLNELINNESTYINGEEVELYQITDSINEEDLRQAAHEHLCGDGLAVYQLYIKALEDFING